MQEHSQEDSKHIDEYLNINLGWLIIVIGSEWQRQSWSKLTPCHDKAHFKVKDDIIVLDITLQIMLHKSFWKPCWVQPEHSTQAVLFPRVRSTKLLVWYQQVFMYRLCVSLYSLNRFHSFLWLWPAVTKASQTLEQMPWHMFMAPSFPI